MSHPKLIPD